MRFKIEKYYAVPHHSLGKITGYVLYHWCDGRDYTEPDGRVCEVQCSICLTKTPKNIMFAYNLWKWHNGV